MHICREARQSIDVLRGWRGRGDSGEPNQCVSPAALAQLSSCLNGKPLCPKISCAFQLQNLSYHITALKTLKSGVSSIWKENFKKHLFLCLLRVDPALGRENFSNFCSSVCSHLLLLPSGLPVEEACKTALGIWLGRGELKSYCPDSL